MNKVPSNNCSSGPEPAIVSPGALSDPDGNGVHGLNERKSVEGLYEERDYLFELIQAYASSK